MSRYLGKLKTGPLPGMTVLAYETTALPENVTGRFTSSKALPWPFCIIFRGKILVTDANNKAVLAHELQHARDRHNPRNILMMFNTLWKESRGEAREILYTNPKHRDFWIKDSAQRIMRIGHMSDVEAYNLLTKWITKWGHDPYDDLSEEKLPWLDRS